MSITFFTPAYIDIVHKTGDRWSRLKPSAIVNMSDKPYNLQEQYSRFGLTSMSILVELYKRYQGLDGWYLVDMRSKDYYYCGATSEDVKKKLCSLKINQDG